MATRTRVRRRRRRIAIAAAALLSVFAVTPSEPAARVAATGPALPAAAGDGWPLRRLAPVIDAFRIRDLPSVRKLLNDGVGDPQRQLLLGIYEHAGGEAARAAPLLATGRDPTLLLEDWRLHALGEALLEQGELAGALDATARTLSAHSDSPLYATAYGRHLEILRLQGDWLGALRGIDAARQLQLHDDLAPRLDVLQWEIADERELIDLQRETARHLLEEHPLIAAELGAVELFRRRDGEVPWTEVLTAPQLVRRARQLLVGDLGEGALSALDAVPLAERDLDWTLVRAEALTAVRRGAAALEALEQRRTTPHDRLTELWELRAAAAIEAATVRRGRVNADSPVRRLWRDSAWRDLWQVALRGDPEARAPALRKLYALADIESNFDVAVGILKRLRTEDSEDITGYQDLWKLGWRSFVREDATVAIGIWRELQDLYPEVSTARQALYWSAIAHGMLDDPERSHRLLRDVLASDTLDFYSLHAARRLGIEPRRNRSLPESEEWPSSPRLARAALLSELGLDDLAANELDLLRSGTEPRAVDGLEALILARQGRRRESIQAIWQAFRRLGRPGQTAIPRSVRQLYYPLDYSDVIGEWAEKRELDRHLIFAIIRQESAFDANAISRSGARGLMQLMPATGQELARRLRLPYSRGRLSQPAYSVQLGTQYFSQVLAMFDGDVQLALAGYNGGPFRIRRWWREADPGSSVDRFIEGLALSETTTYVKRILTLQDSYDQLYGS